MNTYECPTCGHVERVRTAIGRVWHPCPATPTRRDVELKRKQEDQ